MKTRVQIKEEAKYILRNARVSPLLIGAIIVVSVWIMNAFDPTVNYTNAVSDELLRQMEQGASYVATPIPIPAPIEIFFGILIYLVTVVLYGGFYSYCMGIRRGYQMKVSSLADGLGIAGKLIWCDILMSIRIALWSMLFVVPGIIAIYRYRFAVFNLIRDPSLSASQAIALSCRQTHGMKLDLWVLDLSFLFWNILSALTLGILDIWLLPYMALCHLGYYENALLIMNTENNPPYFDPTQMNHN